MAMLTGSAWIALSFWSILSGETLIALVRSPGNDLNHPTDARVRGLTMDPKQSLLHQPLGHLGYCDRCHPQPSFSERVL
jgi:hypothetical protein